MPLDPREAPLTHTPLPLSRLLPATIIAAAPTGFCLLILVALDALSLRDAMLAFIGIWVALLVVLQPILWSFVALREAIELMANDEHATPPVNSNNPFITDLWRATSRLARGLRQRLAQSRAELATNKAVLAALPDPMFLLAERRRIVRANAKRDVRHRPY